MVGSLFSSALSFAATAASLAAEVIAPSVCVACDVRVRSTVLFCPACVTSVERAADDDEGAVFLYGGAVAEAILRMKYGNRPDVAGRLARIMAVTARASAFAGAIDAVVPVPLHPRRLVTRGYNQSVLLASPVARALGVPLCAGVVSRDRDTPRQARQDREGRQKGVAGAFRSAPTPRVAGRRVLLVDDVRTTGSTLEACAEALCRAGARKVTPFVLATTPATAR